jgi:hypothetical protein
MQVLSSFWQGVIFLRELNIRIAGDLTVPAQVPKKIVSKYLVYALLKTYLKSF